ncbi:hypothetical protein [Bradyrhizobium sp. 199]|uniref:hypothetical protein n=1 Tax=Bradyrhizobium sp. 199 TaxID=2782664 RepID=UPI001FFB50EF|nr:hypothetical protein [Bradyrhizobium sp. 199]MCK1358510.1 hypothetical protein [Bradyrhizobium sp. 199]
MRPSVGIDQIGGDEIAGARFTDIRAACEVSQPPTRYGILAKKLDPTKAVDSSFIAAAAGLN